MTKPSYEELRITKHSGSPHPIDSASRTVRPRIAKEIRLKQRQAEMKKKSPFADERFKLNKARHLRILNALKRGQTVYVTFDRTVYTPNFHHNAQRGRVISADQDCFLVRVLLEKHKHPHRFYTGFLIPTTREPR